MAETDNQATKDKIEAIEGLAGFMDLPIEARLELILERTFPAWCIHANEGISLVYDHSTLMIAEVITQVLGLGHSGKASDCEVFSNRTVLNIETGYDAFDPDAGAFRTSSKQGPGLLFMVETAVRAMSSSDAPFDARFLLPQDPENRAEMQKTYKKVFSTQFRFWSEDHGDFEARLASFRAQMAEFLQITVVEKQMAVVLRKTNRFRLKRKVLDFYETPVRAIAIGQDLTGWSDAEK